MEKNGDQSLGPPLIKAERYFYEEGIISPRVTSCRKDDAFRFCHPFCALEGNRKMRFIMMVKKCLGALAEHSSAVFFLSN